MALSEEEERRYQELKAKYRGGPVIGTSGTGAPPAPTPGAAPTPVPSGDVQLSFTPTPTPTPSPTPAPKAEPVGPEGYRSKYEGYPDWSDMPELGEMSWGNLKTRFGKAMGADADDMKKLIKKEFGIEGQATEDGYIVFQSKKDGKEYVWKPGIQTSDITHGAARVAAPFLLAKLAPAAVAARVASMIPSGVAGGAILGAADAAVDELGQAVVGLQPDPGNVLLGAATGGAIPAASEALKTAAVTARGPTTAQLRSVVAAQQAARAAQPPMNPRQALVAASRGDTQAQKQIADAYKRNPTMEAAANVFGNPDELPPAALVDLSAKAGREAAELDQRAVSAAAPLAKTQQDEQLGRLAKGVSDKMADLGAEPFDALSASVQGVVARRHEALDRASEVLWGDLVPKALAGKPGVSQDALKAAMNKSPIQRPEKLLKWIDSYSRNVSKEFPALARIREALTPRRGYTPDWQTLQKYAKQAGEAASGRGLWKDEDRGLMKKLYGFLDEARIENADRIAEPGALLKAKAATAQRKVFEDQIEVLFGKQLEQALGGDLLPHVMPAIKDAAAGNTQRLKTLESVLSDLPAGLKEKVVLSGITSMFEKAGAGQAVNWAQAADFYNRLDSRPTAKAFLMSQLSPDARKAIEAHSTLSKQIAEVIGLRSKTGNPVGLIKQLRDADTGINRFMNFVSEKLPLAGATLGSYAGWSTGSSILGITGGGLAGRLLGSMAQKAVGGVHTAADQAVEEFLMSPALPLLVKGVTGKVPVDKNFFQKLGEHRAAKKLAIAMKVPMPQWQRDLQRALIPAANLGAQQGPPTVEEN